MERKLTYLAIYHSSYQLFPSPPTYRQFTQWRRGRLSSQPHASVMPINGVSYHEQWTMLKLDNQVCTWCRVSQIKFTRNLMGSLLQILNLPNGLPSYSEGVISHGTQKWDRMHWCLKKGTQSQRFPRAASHPCILAALVRPSSQSLNGPETS